MARGGLQTAPKPEELRASENDAIGVPFNLSIPQSRARVLRQRVI